MFSTRSFIDYSTFSRVHTHVHFVQKIGHMYGSNTCTSFVYTPTSFLSVCAHRNFADKIGMQYLKDSCTEDTNSDLIS